MHEVKVGVIGFGTVGAGVVRLLLQNRAVIEKRLGFPLTLAKVADLDVTTDRGIQVPASLLTTDAGEVIEDPDIPLVVELIGGLEPARTFTLQALGKGKGVVTANKALLAHHWQELCGASQEGGGRLGFEASVGGGIPVIRALREGLVANRIESIHGIINGTSNYILTRMSEEGLDFETALRRAQEMGYAEADPGLDIDGGDAAHKLAILASLAFDTCVPLDKIYTEGISGISLIDLEIARELGYVVKLLAVAKAGGERVEARVHPTMIPKGHLLATVGDVFNAIYIRGDAVGPTLLYGLGAGSLPTASAVVADLVEMARSIRAGGGPSPFRITLEEERPIVPMAEVRCPCYIRFMSPDRPGILAAISGVLARHEISIASVIQRGREAGSAVPIVMMTHSAREASVRAALEEIARQQVVTAPPVCIRVEESGEESSE
jgi:homoserine dehydrogenase